MSNTDIFDGILMNVVQKAEGIEGFYEAIFSFMRRKTDFYSSTEKGKTCVIAAFNRHAALFNENKERQELIKQKQDEQKKKQEEEEAKNKPTTQEAPVESSDKVEEITDEEAEKMMNGTGTETATPGPKVLDTSRPEASKEGEGEGDEEAGPPLIGNGLTTDKYSFTQTLQDFTLSVFLPDGLKGKDLTVDYSTKKLKVQIKGQSPIIDGELAEKIKTEETVWTIDNVEGRRV